MNTTLKFVPNGIHVLEDPAHRISQHAWNWIFNTFTQANGASLKTIPGKLMLETSDPNVAELIHDIAGDDVPYHWDILHENLKPVLQ